MPDLLSHVLVAYVVVQVLAWRVDRLSKPHAVVAMAGALLPDLVKVTMFVPPSEVASLLGVAFSWLPLHRLGGIVAVAGILAGFVESRARGTVFVLLLGGAAIHLLLDLFLARPGPWTYDLLYPLTRWRAPVLGLDLYHSFDRWPSLASGALAAAVALLTRYRGGIAGGDSR